MTSSSCLTQSQPQFASLHLLVGDRASGKVTAEPDAAVLKIVDTWPTQTSLARALTLGLPQDADVDAIVRSFIEDFGGQGSLQVARIPRYSGITGPGRLCPHRIPEDGVRTPWR